MKKNAGAVKPVTFAAPRMTTRDLPPVGTKRWTMKVKASIVRAVREGLLTRQEACRQYGISEEEFSLWHQLISQHGAKALRVTRLGEYRGVTR